MNARKTIALVQNDLNRSLTSTRGILFLVFYGIFWFWMLKNLSDGGAVALSNPENNSALGVIFSWLGLSDNFLGLFLQHPPTLVAYFYLALSSMPLFALWASSDQTAGDLDTRFIRFLTPRVGRPEIYIGRFMGTTIFFCGCISLVTAVAVLISLSIDPSQPAEVLAYGLKIECLLCLYALPFIALMSFFTVATGSPGIAALSGIGSYAVLVTSVPLLALNAPNAEVVLYLVPSVFKTALITLDGIATAMIGLLIQSLAYFLLGWVIFKKRDI